MRREQWTLLSFELYLLVLFRYSTLCLCNGIGNGEGMDPVIAPFPDSTVQPTTNVLQFEYLQHPKRMAYVVTTNQVFSVGVPEGVGKLWKTTHQSQRHGCDVAATNGGPFHGDGTSCGPVVIRGQLIQNVSTDFVGFGTTRHGQWVLGRYDQLSELDIDNFLTGFGWLVYEGRDITINTSENDTGAQRAARTAVGIDGNGMLVILVADGCEKW